MIAQFIKGYIPLKCRCCVFMGSVGIRSSSESIVLITSSWMFSSAICRPYDVIQNSRRDLEISWYSECWLFHMVIYDDIFRGITYSYPIKRSDIRWIFIEIFVMASVKTCHCWSRLWRTSDKLLFKPKVTQFTGAYPLHLTSMSYPDSKVHGANMGPNWGRQDPGGHHVGPMNLAIWVSLVYRDQRTTTSTCSNSSNIFWSKTNWGIYPRVIKNCIRQDKFIKLAKASKVNKIILGLLQT